MQLWVSGDRHEEAGHIGPHPLRGPKKASSKHRMPQSQQKLEKINGPRTGFSGASYVGTLTPSAGAMPFRVGAAGALGPGQGSPGPIMFLKTYNLLHASQKDNLARKNVQPLTSFMFIVHF